MQANESSELLVPFALPVGKTKHLVKVTLAKLIVWNVFKYHRRVQLQHPFSVTLSAGKTKNGCIWKQVENFGGYFSLTYHLKLPWYQAYKFDDMKQIERGRQKRPQLFVFVDVLVELQVVGFVRVFFHFGVNIAETVNNDAHQKPLVDRAWPVDAYLRMAMSKFRSRILSPTEKMMLKAMATFEPTWSGHVAGFKGSLTYWSVESLASVALQSPTFVESRYK